MLLMKQFKLCFLIELFFVSLFVWIYINKSFFFFFLPHWTTEHSHTFHYGFRSKQFYGTHSSRGHRKLSYSYKPAGLLWILHKIVFWFCFFITFVWYTNEWFVFLSVWSLSYHTWLFITSKSDFCKTDHDFYKSSNLEF